MIPESEENRLDESLRSKFEDFDLTPGAPVWAGIAQRLPPPPRLRPRRRPVLLPLLFVLTGLLAGLGGWVLRGPAAAVRESRTGFSALNNRQPKIRHSETAISEQQRILRKTETAASGHQRVPGSSGAPFFEQQRPLRDAGAAKSTREIPLRNTVAGTSTQGKALRISAAIEPSLIIKTTKLPADSVATIASSETVAAQVLPGAVANNAVSPSAETLPATLRPLAALERQTLEQLPGIGTLAPGARPAGGRAALLTNLRAERAELFRLQHYLIAIQYQKILFTLNSHIDIDIYRDRDGDIHTYMHA